MGNCCSRFKSPESRNPPSSAPPSMDTSGDPVRSVTPTPMEPSLATSRDPVPSPPPPPPMEPSQLPTSRDPIKSIEEIAKMYKGINPQLIDPLESIIKTTQLDNLQTPSQAGSSSSQRWLATVGDATDLAAKAIETICKEAETLSKSDVVKEMGKVTLKVMEAVGESHWAFLGLSFVAFGVTSYMSIESTEKECKDLLHKILELAKDVKQYCDQMPDKEKVGNAISIIVEGVVICHGYLKKGKFHRFWSASTAADQLEKTNQELRDVRASLSFTLNLQIQKQLTMRQKQSPRLQLDFKPVGIEKQVEDVKALLDMEGASSALAVNVCGFGGVGKTTLAKSVLQSLDLLSDIKFCKVAIDEHRPDKTSYIKELQKDIILALTDNKFDIPDPEDGRLKIKDALKNKYSLIFIDNVVDKTYIRELLPEDLSSDQQKTKVRILITSRKRIGTAELGIDCKVHEVETLSEKDRRRLLSETILKGEDVKKDFDEESMINKVADACRGVPLLLSVFGMHLKADRNKEIYEEALRVLTEGNERNLDNYLDEDLVGTKLMFVYNNIQDAEVKETFLDICTYFHGWDWNLVADIVNYPKLADLHRRTLVSRSGSDEVIVHDILRLMGMEKARSTRFSNLDGIKNLKDVKGISLVKGNLLITQLEAMSQSLRVLMLGDWVTLDGPPSDEAFPNLRYFLVGDISTFPFKDPSKLNNLKVFLNRSKPGMSLSNLPPSLKYISHEVPEVECDKFVRLPFQNLSSLKSFVVKTRKSVELPEEIHLPASLVDLDLNRCRNVPKCNGHLTALESLILDRSDLECLPQGFGKLEKLKHLSMDYCSKLTSLSEELGMLSSLEALSMKDCRTLTYLPESLGGLSSLKTLVLTGCINLQRLPESFGKLHIRSLQLHWLQKLHKLPNSFGKMSLLKDLSLISCHSLESLPSSFVELEMLETLKISDCTKLSVLPEDFGQLTCLKHMTVEDCHLLKELPHGFAQLKKLRSLKIERCLQLKTLPDDFENLATLEKLWIPRCPELEGAMIEKILKLQNCYTANICGSTKLSEKWKRMQGKTEQPMMVAIQSEYHVDWKETRRAIGVALLHGKCMEVNDSTDKLMEISSLLEGLEEGMSATVALIMLPVTIHLQSHQHQNLQRFVETARETADKRGSSSRRHTLQIVCARKVDLDAEIPTPTEEEKRAEEEAIRQILLPLQNGWCAIPSAESKRVRILTYCCSSYDKLNFVMADVRVDTAGRKIWENFKVTSEDRKPRNLDSVSHSESKNEHCNSLQNFIQNVIGRSGPSESECDAGESKSREFIEALKASGVDHLLMHNNTSKESVDVLYGKTIGIIVCDFIFLECIKLQQIYKDLQQKDSNFIMIWIPRYWPEDCGHGTYTRLIQCMPWATVPHPQLVNVQVDDPVFVVLDKHGQIAKRDALPLLLAWGAKSYPFTQHTIPESFCLMESESCLEFLLRGMTIVGRRPMKSKITFLYAAPTYQSEWLRMKRQLEELTQIHGNFEVLFVGDLFYDEFKYYTGDSKEEYDQETEKMPWPSLSFSDMIMFWYRCRYFRWQASNRMMDDLTKHLLRSTRLAVVDNDGELVTRNGYDVVQMICGSRDKMWEGERMVKDALSRGECGPLVKTFFTDEIHNHYHQDHYHRLLCIPPRNSYTCDMCFSKGLTEWYEERSYRCSEWRCRWDLCGSCWRAYAAQQVEQRVRAKDYSSE